MKRLRFQFRSFALAAAGVALVLAAALVSNRAIEQELGRAPGSLAWGPALFRALLAINGIMLALAGFRHRSSPEDALSLLCSSRDGCAPRVVPVWIALSLLSVLALALRLWKLNTCLWLDEVLALLEFSRPSLAHIVTSFPSQNQHMLYSILAHASIRLFGESAWALRLPAVFFGVASLWALFLLGRRLMGTREALLACALMTVSYHHLWFSQNARGYTGLLLFSILATWLWLEALSRSGRGWWTAYAFAGFFGLWVHMTMAFVLAAHALVYLVLLLLPGSPMPLGLPLCGAGGFACPPRDSTTWQAKRPASHRPGSLRANSRWKPVAAFLLCGALTLQVYALSLPEFLRTALHEVSLSSDWTHPSWLLRESLRNLRIGFSGWAVVLAGGAMAAAGWLSLWHRDWRAGAALILPALLGGATMLVLGHNLWPRFFFFSMGFGLLAAVHGAMTLPRVLLSREPWATRAGVVLVSLMIAASALTLPRCYAYPKQDFTGARDYVEQCRKPTEDVVSVGLAAQVYGYFAPRWAAPQSDAEFAALRRSRAFVWLVYTLPIQVRAWHPQIWQAIQQDYEVVKVFPGTLGDGGVYVCRERPEKSATIVSHP